MSVLGDINPRSAASFDSSGWPRPAEPSERLAQSARAIADVPLRITDERYRLECDRLREDEAWQEMETCRPRLPLAPRAATAVEEPEVSEVNDSASTIDDAPIDLSSVSNELTQEHRQRAADQLFASLGYVKLVPRQKARAPWTAVIVLVLALVALVGYGYFAMRQNGVSPWRLPGVATAITVHRHLEAAQARANADLQAARERSDHLIAVGRERWARWRR